MIYIAFIETHEEFGTAIVTINGAEADGITETTYGIGHKHFSDQDKISIGPGFIGKLRRVQIFSPATAFLQQGDCVPSSCAINPNFEINPGCLARSCNTPGSFTSFGDCERIILILFSCYPSHNRMSN